MGVTLVIDLWGVSPRPFPILSMALYFSSILLDFHQFISACNSMLINYVSKLLSD